jgi:predicted enzyme related to lactoylglutathione lyase
MNVNGHFVWYELLTDDTEAAKAFYGAVLGWKTRPFGDGAHPYSIWTSGETPLGGVMKILPEWAKAGERAHWWAHVAVEDVDAATAKAQELGGTVRTPPTDIPEVGRFAIVADPQGAVISLLASKREPMALPDRRQAGLVGWHELSTTDYRAAWTFYSELFGWKHTTDFDMGAWGLYFMFRHPGDPEGVSLGGMFNGARETGSPPRWLYYVNVESIDAAVARVTANGGTINHGPVEVPGGGRVARCTDPQGAAFAVFAQR